MPRPLVIAEEEKMISLKFEQIPPENSEHYSQRKFLELYQRLKKVIHALTRQDMGCCLPESS